MSSEACQGLVDKYCDEKTYPEEWDLEGLARALYGDLCGRG